MKKITRGLILSVVAGAVLYVAFAAHAEWKHVRAALAHFDWRLFALALLLAATNYGIRFLKWHDYLRRLGVRIPAGRSLSIFLSGFTLTVTPGKMGEVIKSYLLRESDGIPMARTAPVVVAERVTDLIALLLLAASGALTYQIGLRGIMGGAALVILFLGLVSSRRLMHKLLVRLGHRALELYESMHLLLRPAPLLVATVLSIAAWASECIAFWLIIGGFQGASCSIGAATTIYASMTVVGALSFLPGGLGVTEAGMTLLLCKLAQGMTEATAFAATFATRLATLWFGVAVGLVALLIFQKRHHVRMELAQAGQPTPLSAEEPS